MQLESSLTCPHCSFEATEMMPTDACQFFYVCKGCGQKLKPPEGDCCVFCSYGSVRCPPVQENGKGAKRWSRGCRGRSQSTSNEPVPQRAFSRRSRFRH